MWLLTFLVYQLNEQVN